MKNTYSSRSILLALGVGEVNATLAIQQIQLAPRDSDPDAAATIVIVSAVQRGLNQTGCLLQETGRLDNATMACIARMSGPKWESKSWLLITKDILNLKRAGLDVPSLSHQEVGLGTTSFGKSAGMLLLIGGLAYLALKKN
jgi:hypothetical protein